MTKFNIGDVVVVKNGGRYVNTGKAAKVVGLLAAGEAYEDYDISDNESLILRALCGKFEVEDNGELVYVVEAPCDSCDVELIK